MYLTNVLDILKDDQGVVPSVFIYGHTATGKSLVATSLLEAFEVSSYKHIPVCVCVGVRVWITLVSLAFN